MVRGNEMWDMEIVGDMKEKTISKNIEITTYPEMPDNMYEALTRTSAKHCGKTFLVDNYGREYSYSLFQARVDELAAFLHCEKGVGTGCHVGLMMYNCAEFCIAFLALVRLGAVTVPLPSKFKKAEVLSLTKRADVELVLCDVEFKVWFQELYQENQLLVVQQIETGYGYRDAFTNWKDRDVHIDRMRGIETGNADDAAVIMFTSGTTSSSKGVLLKNYNLMHATETYKRILHITDSDCSVIATPIYHITGLVALLGLFICAGGTLYLHKFFDAKRVIEEARTYGFTFIHASPTVYNLLIQEGEKTPAIPSLISFACGSSNMPKEQILRLHRWLPDSVFHTVYGLTETSSPATIFPGNAAVSSLIGSSGRPVPGTNFKILGEDKRELLADEIGEIVISGSVVLEQYYKQEDISLHDGWLSTGDVGYFNDDGYLFIVDRKKNMINRGGEKIWCYDIENELISMKGVRDAAVVGIPDELYGEVAAAIVLLEGTDGPSAFDIQEYLSSRIAKYKIPVKIKFVNEIPQTVNGKIDKRGIKQILMEDET